MAPDAYVAIQGQTSVVTCGECMRKVDLNKYLTGISTEASVDAPPGSATINLSIPDTDINEFYVEGNFVIIPMMELEIYAKGYYTVGGVPQYYKIFWGMIISISKNWSNGVTTFTLSCKDILHWWEKTNIILNPAFVGSEGASCGYQLFGNQMAGTNPYTVIIALAREAMGDFSITDGSFMSHKPEAGPEATVIGGYAKDVMSYWQMKFGNIWNSLVLYGSSGMAYTFEGLGDVSPVRLATSIFTNERDVLDDNRLTFEFKLQPYEIAAYKQELDKAGDVQFFQNDTQSKLSVALQARDQIQYEFYCDTTGDIVFKPPFYNLNVMPNKPVSWINDFEIIDDSINDSEAEVVTHMTSSGNAFGGVMDFGLTDEITVPRTGVIDWHLLKRYGWRRQDFQCEWAGNPKKLFWFLLDMMDRINAKRHNGTVTIPMRPEIRMGFPVWIPYYDSFYYVNGVSHNYSPGGQATTTLTLVAKRSKFIAPSNMGSIVRVPPRPPAAESQSKSASTSKNQPNKGTPEKEKNAVPKKPQHAYKVTFNSSVGQTAGLDSENQGSSPENTPLIIRDPNTGKILGYPNVVMVYRTTFSGEAQVKQTSSKGNLGGKNKNQNQIANPRYRYENVVRETFQQLRDQRKAAIINRIRHHRYEAGMSNAGLYDYAVDESGDFKEMTLIPISSIVWGAGSEDPTTGLVGAAAGDPAKAKPQKQQKSQKAAPGNQPQQPSSSSQNNGFDGSNPEEYVKNRNEELEKRIKALRDQLGKSTGKTGLYADKKKKSGELRKAKDDLAKTVIKNHKSKNAASVNPEQYNAEETQKLNIVNALSAELDAIDKQISEIENKISELESSKTNFRLSKNLNVSVRPVSDEFGFEVIGHNRYGRGVFIDRGQLRLKMTGTEDQPAANQFNIQFAAVGSLMMTDEPKGLRNTVQTITTSSYESMQPEDWTTGASMHSSGEVTLTSVNTYSSAINRAIDTQSSVRTVFIEADASRRAKTMWELHPTAVNGLDEVGFPACNCSLSRFQWFSVLPKEIMQEMLSPSMGDTYTTEANPFLLAETYYIDSFTGEKTQEPMSSQTRVLPAVAAVGASLIFGGAGALAASAISSPTEERSNKRYVEYQQKDNSGEVVNTVKKEIITSGQPGPEQVLAPPPTQLDVGTPVSPSWSASSPAPPSWLTEEMMNDPSFAESVRQMNTTPGLTGGNPSGLGVTSFPTFFDRLNKYLTEKFLGELDQYNNVREAQNSGLDLSVEISPPPGEDSYIDPNSVLGPSGGSLFDRASLGDPQALEALQNQINWNWSATNQAAKELDEATNGNPDEAEDKFKEWASSWSAAAAGAGAAAATVKAAAAAAQPQPFTPSPVKLNITVPPDPFTTVQQTYPFKQTTNTGTGSVPVGPPPPKQSNT